MPAIAFIDLLATKDSALVGDDEFLDAMEFFHETLMANKQILGKGSKLRHFADCCYLECPDLVKLIKYVRVVRFHLFSERRFFKCAIGLGSLEERSVTELDEAGVVDGIDIEGTTFGPGVASVYLDVERFRGVGVHVSKEAISSLSQADRDSYLIESAYFATDEDTNLQSYTDIRLGNNELDEGSLLISEVIQSLSEAKSVKNKYAKYYFPTMMLWIKSHPISSDDVVKHTEDDEVTKCYKFSENKMIYRFFFGRTGHSFYKKFPDMPQYSSLYMAFLQRFIDSELELAPLEFVIRKIPVPSKVFRTTAKVPEFIISRANKQTVTRIHARIKI